MPYIDTSPRNILARWPPDFAHMRMAQSSLSQPHNTFSAPTPDTILAMRCAEAVVIEVVAPRHAVRLLVGGAGERGAVGERRPAVLGAEAVEIEREAGVASRARIGGGDEGGAHGGRIDPVSPRGEARTLQFGIT